MSLDELIQNNCLLPEIEEGNIEYKLKLTHNEKELDFRVEELTSQMKWRLREGHKKSGQGCAYYFLGLNDDGSIGGINIQIINASLKILNRVIKNSNAAIDSTHISMFNDGVVAMVKISALKNAKAVDEFRVIMLGDTNAGKSSIIGSLTYDIKDNGKGVARHNIFQYQHEHDTGRTSSIKCEISGFTKEKGSFLNYAAYFNEPWENIFKRSDGIIHFIDLPGDIRYMKTTLFGIMSYMPHILIVVIDLSEAVKYHNTEPDINGSNPKQITLNQYFNISAKKYLDICYHMSAQSVVIFNKVDLISLKEYAQIYTEFEKYINDTYSKCTYALDGTYDQEEKNNDFAQNVYVISFSCVTHLNMDIFKQFLMDSTSSIKLTDATTNTADGTNSQYVINDWMYVPEVGPVISGTMVSGCISVHNKLLMGPFGKNFHTIKVQSIHKKQVSSDTIFSGESGSMVVEIVDGTNILNTIDKHLSIITPNRLEFFMHKFEIISFDPICDKITTGSQYTIYTMNVIEAALVQNVEKINDKMWKIVFIFTKPDIIRYIYNGSNAIFRKENDIFFGKCYRYEPK